jgi:hypothetical protein
MRDRDTNETYTVHIAGEWSLEDLYVFPRTFEQVYFLVYSLLPDLDELAIERIDHAYRKFPWQGGYSAVNFYNQLKYATPKQDRPQIASIRYESPGWIEIGLLVAAAYAVERIVKRTASTIKEAHDVYDRIIRGLSERKLLRLEVKRKALELKKEELEYIDFCVALMAKLLGFQNIQEINARTGSPYKTLKILLSLFRRVRTLVEYKESGKADFRGGKK